jgi:hypothetical protein
LHRHRKEIPKKIVKAAEARDIVLGDTLLTQVRGLIGKASVILERAEASGDDRVALQAVREVRETLHLLAKITGEIRPEGQERQSGPMFVLSGDLDINVTVQQGMQREVQWREVRNVTPEPDAE